MPSILVLDIGILTVMLFLAGRASNPFALFYLLHMTMGVFMLPSRGAWSAVGLCILGFSLLFLSPHQVFSWWGTTCCDDPQMHLLGLLIARALTGSGIAYFVRQLTGAVQASRQLAALS